MAIEWIKGAGYRTRGGELVICDHVEDRICKMRKGNGEVYYVDKMFAMRSGQSSDLDVIGLAGQDVDPVDHPPHYMQHPSGVECIEITEHMNFCRGNAIKYIWRAGEKGDELEDLRKAAWYVQREIARIEKQRAKQ
jgi:hypothetical protein